MAGLPADAARNIEQIHADWIAFEVAGENDKLITLCADDVEIWPPDAKPVRGLAAVCAHLSRGESRIHSIEITDRRIQGSNDIAYLTANYKTEFSSADDACARWAIGSHLWILRKRIDRWAVVLIAWSSWGGAGIGRQQ
jgi:ketosteroid isomerase-like protein